jgi:uncharacterized damage-inducible protein DinB
MTEDSTTEDTRRTTVSIEVEMGFDGEDWGNVGLEERPENAEALLAQVKEESNGRISTFIDDWSLDDFVTVTITISHNDDGKVTSTTARWTRP